MMSSSKPFLVEAIHQWILSNEMSPYLVVNALNPDVVVPVDYVNNGQIILNMTPVAIHKLFMDHEAISFQARFQGVVHDIYVPVSAVIALYAHETGRGMVFDLEESDVAQDGAAMSYVAPPADPSEQPDGPQTTSASTPQKGKRPGQPKLTIVK